LNKIVFRHGPATDLQVLDIGEPAFTSDTNILYIGTADGNKRIGESSINGTVSPVSCAVLDLSDQIVAGGETKFDFGAPVERGIVILNGLAQNEFSINADEAGMVIGFDVSIGDDLLFLAVMR